MTAYYLTADLFFSSRVAGAAQRVGTDLKVVGSLSALLAAAEESGQCSLVVIDLTLPALDVSAAMPEIKQRWPGARVVAYGPHVHEAHLSAANAAGCDEVLTRGQFDREMERVLRHGE
jgi:DNA-binding NarL/FixJ family response regulator